ITSIEALVPGLTSPLNSSLHEKGKKRASLAKLLIPDPLVSSVPPFGISLLSYKPSGPNVSSNNGAVPCPGNLGREGRRGWVASGWFAESSICGSTDHQGLHAPSGV